MIRGLGRTLIVRKRAYKAGGLLAAASCLCAAMSYAAACWNLGEIERLASDITILQGAIEQDLHGSGVASDHSTIRDLHQKQWEARNTAGFLNSAVGPLLWAALTIASLTLGIPEVLRLRLSRFSMRTSVSRRGLGVALVVFGLGLAWWAQGEYRAERAGWTDESVLMIARMSAFAGILLAAVGAGLFASSWKSPERSTP